MLCYYPESAKKQETKGVGAISVYCWHVIVIRHIVQYNFGHLMAFIGCTELYRGCMRDRKGQHRCKEEETALNYM